MALRFDGDRALSYRAQLRDESVRTAHLDLIAASGRACDDWDVWGRPGHVAMLLENHPELISLYGWAAATRGTRSSA